MDKRRQARMQAGGPIIQNTFGSTFTLLEFANRKPNL